METYPFTNRSWIQYPKLPKTMEPFCGGLPCGGLSCGTLTLKMAFLWFNGAVKVATNSRMAETKIAKLPNLGTVRMLRDLYRNRDGLWEIDRYVGEELASELSSSAW